MDPIELQSGVLENAQNAQSDRQTFLDNSEQQAT